MSADEIRRLAEKLKPEEGCFVCNHEVLKPVHSALLVYAAMVERCEAEIALTDKTHYTYKRLNYILKGATYERK